MIKTHKGFERTLLNWTTEFSEGDLFQQQEEEQQQNRRLVLFYRQKMEDMKPLGLLLHFGSSPTSWNRTNWPQAK